MKSFKSFFALQVVIVTLLVGSFKTASAGMVTGVLDAASVVNNFNSMNGGTGLNFIVKGGDSGASRLDNIKGKEFADTSAYHRSKGITQKEFTYLYSFCVEPNVKSHDESLGKLNYANGKSQTTSGNALTVGAAYLYTMFATNQLSGYDYNSVGAAIRYLIGDPNTGEGLSSALNDLLRGTNSDMDYWTQAYDPNNFYSEIGDYSVFVMNVTSKTPGAMGVNSQDRLYVASAANPYAPPEPPTNATPEPASILIFGLGAVGLGLIRKSK
ncbi:MAG: PEP-CTERM sorting domain-containing protein [Planctomycetaceae bacterium]|jgi:hypothetical protein|nr:PEP-CTERM sorting domain-containing protein [Planctomycetaceae bacterium]